MYNQYYHLLGHLILSLFYQQHFLKLQDYYKIYYILKLVLALIIIHHHFYPLLKMLSLLHFFLIKSVNKLQ